MPGGGAQLVAVVAVVVGLFLFDQGLHVQKTVKAGQFAFGVHHGQLADLVLDHHLVRLKHRDGVFRDNRFLGHHVADADVVVGEELEIAGW